VADIGWLPERSADAVGRAVARAAPALADRPIELRHALKNGDPAWSRATAWVGDDFVVKFAWSREAAQEVWREGEVVQALARTAFARLMPAVEHFSANPVLLVLRRYPGVPAWGEVIGHRAARERIGRDLGAALSVLHRPDVLAVVEDSGAALPAPTPQADTAAIRDRLGAFAAPRHMPLVQRWCDWVDETQAAPDRPLPVLLHGDLHGHNVLCERGRVTRVLDYDGVSVGEHHYDFRYLPGIRASGLELFAAAVGRYEALSGRAVSPARVLAWHIRTVLGDALWRSEAGVELPDGGTVDEWVVALRQRVRDLAAWRAFPGPED
jgi:aminoglycoside phosphotransferase (APT) family kinase protein